MTARPFRDGAGFSLVELLVVMAIFGLVTTAIYSTYLASRRTASSQGEVVEVQQNLRVALDFIARDLRMAGALLPSGATPLAASAGPPTFPTHSTIMMNTASAEGQFVRVEIENPPDNSYTVAGTPTRLTLPLEAPPGPNAINGVDAFAVGDRVRLIRTLDGSQPLTGTQTLVISNVAGNPSRGTFDGGTPPAIIAPPSITISKTDGTAFTSDDTVRSSDLIAKVADATYPMTVSYFLVPGGAVIGGSACPPGQRCLVRQVNGSAARSDIVATNMAAVEFDYLDDSYHEAAVPATLSAVRAVRVTLHGTTARTAALSQGARVRMVRAVVKLRNRR